MTVTTFDLNSIAIQSKFLSEYLNQDFTEIKQKQLTKDSYKIFLESWSKIVGQGQWEILEKRLEWDEFSLNQVRNLLENNIGNEIESLPSWVETLNSILETASTFSLPIDNISDLPIDSDNP